MNPDNPLFHPLFGLTITIAAYMIAQKAHRKWSKLHPLVMTVGTLLLFLWITGIPFEAYKAGGDLIVFFLGPATIALGVPIYKQASRIKKHLLPIVSGITLGSLSSILTAGGIVWLLGGSSPLILTMLPKSATTPIAVEIVRHLGGYPELGAVATTLTGLLGGVIGPQFLRFCGIRTDIPIGAAMGTASHGIGTARLVSESELAASVSGFSMGFNGILTAIVLIPVHRLFFG